MCSMSVGHCMFNKIHVLNHIVGAQDGLHNQEMIITYYHTGSSVNFDTIIKHP